MRFRSVLVAAAAAVLLLAPASNSFAQRGGNARYGTIKSVDAAGKSMVVTVRRMNNETDVTVKTDDQTRYFRGVDQGAFGDLKAGAFIVFAGQGQPDTGISAREVFILEKAGGVANGAVKSVDAGGKSFVVVTGRPGGQQREVTVKVGDKTKFWSGRDAAKWEDVAAEKRVLVIGEGSPQTGLTAIHVRILPAAGGGQ
jgi:hypothetical protein